MVGPEQSQNAFTEKLAGFCLLVFGCFLVTETMQTLDCELGKEGRHSDNRC